MLVPNVLYKYCSAETAIDILESRSLKFTNLGELNDPFEFLPSFGCLPNSIDDVLAEDCLDFASQLAAACPSGVCSFSSERDNLLMWAHYGKWHTGIVIGFATANSFFRDRLYRVNYSKRRPTIRLSHAVSSDELETTITWQPSEDDFRQVLTTKSEHWHYESEWRLIRKFSECRRTKSRSGIHVLSVPQSAICEVIMGVRLAKEHQDGLPALLGRCGYATSVRLLPARLNAELFTLEVP